VGDVGNVVCAGCVEGKVPLAGCVPLVDGCVGDTVDCGVCNDGVTVVGVVVCVPGT